jgi:hypothetical protein
MSFMDFTHVKDKTSWINGHSERVCQRERGWGREGGRMLKKGRDIGGEKEGGCERKREREEVTERGRGGVRERGGK